MIRREGPFVNIREGSIPYLGHETYYRIVEGNDPSKAPLLLLHGGPGSTHNYFEVLDPLAERTGRSLIMYDQIGCGKSYLEGHPEYWKMETWAGELQAIVRELGLREYFVLGQSWGGMLLLESVCHQHLQGVKGIILSSTLPSSRLWGEQQKTLIATLPPEMQRAIAKAAKTGNYDDPEYAAAEAEYMLRFAGDPHPPEEDRKPGTESYEVAWGPDEFTPVGTLKDYDVTELLPTITLPALVISGERDLCTPVIARTMAEGIPNARWELFAGCRHGVFTEEPEKYMALISSWMDEHE